MCHPHFLANTPSGISSISAWQLQVYYSHVYAVYLHRYWQYQQQLHWQAAPEAKNADCDSTTAPIPPTTEESIPQADDLKLIEGIGPKIEQLMNEAGIYTWAELAAAGVRRLRKILAAAGKRYAIHDPGTWPKQAKLAAAGKMDQLKVWQEKLKGGK